MTKPRTITTTPFPAWQGWIRRGGGFPAAVEAADDRRREMGAAVFSLPEPGEAKTTSWAQSGGRFGVFTGYLYNRRELAAELALETDPADPTPPSAVEVALAGYLKWGGDVLGKLEGSFAVAVWDQPRETLLCGRDPVGLHPFFYSLTGEDRKSVV